MAILTVTVYKINGQYYPDGCERELSCSKVLSLAQNVPLELPAGHPLVCDDDIPAPVQVEIIQLPNGDKWWIEQGTPGFFQACINASPAPDPGGESILERTIAVINDEIDAGTLVPGQLYKITGVNPNLYSDIDFTGQNTIYLRALSTTELESSGSGEFYNPDHENIPVYKGDGVYAFGDKVVWNGKVFSNLDDDNTGEPGASASWALEAFNVTNYIKVLDQIEYDIINDTITQRREVENNITVRTTKIINDNLGFNPIEVMAWGKKGILTHINVNCGVLNCRNFNGAVFSHVDIEPDAIWGVGVYSEDCEIDNIKLETFATVTNYSFGIGASLENLLVKSSAFYSNVDIRAGASIGNLEIGFNGLFDAVIVQENAEISNVKLGSEAHMTNIGLAPGAAQFYITLHEKATLTNIALEEDSSQTYITIGREGSMNAVNLANSASQDNITIGNESSMSEFDIGVAAHQSKITLYDNIGWSRTGTNITAPDGEINIKRGYGPFRPVVFKISQSGTDIPTHVMLDNEPELSIVWTRFDVGTYVGTLSKPLDRNQTTLFITGLDLTSVATINQTDDAHLQLTTSNYVGGDLVAADDQLSNSSVEIREYYSQVQP